MSTLSHDDLSVEQDRICAIERRSPGNPACILRQLLRIEGPLNEDAFRRAVDAVIDRHPALRTVFSFKDGRSTVLSGSAPISVEVIELGPIPPSAWVEEAQRRALDEAKHPFDLEAGPLTRFKLLRFSPESHVLLIAAHAAVLDEESADRLFDEIIEAYEPVLRDGLSRSSEFPRAEAESGRWHRHWIEKMGKGAHLAYWKEQVAGELPILELPTDRPRP
ncbi:MAG TPA: condensation domain-containing protein, partial [Polyangiaceae bacterium]|nr:condensation domain-containing protein [Polyangiaceae bacterium]